MCEISRNSVVHFGFENKIKKHWVGKTWYLSGVKSNDMEKTNVPNIRVAFHHETLREELDMFRRYSQLTDSPMVTTAHHDLSKHMASSVVSPALFVFAGAHGGSATPNSPFALNLQTSSNSFLNNISDMNLIRTHPHLPKASMETIYESGGVYTNVIMVAHQLGMLSVVAGISEMG